MRKDIPYEFEDILGPLPEADNGEEDAPSPIQKFAESAGLAGFVGWPTASAVAEETQKRTAAANASIIKGRAEQPSHWDTQKTAERDATLAKATDSAAERRKRTLHGWLESEIALGKSVSELVSYAERTDPKTARVLRELAAEFGLS